ncbi:hypothetical protein FCOIX_10421 [Fusarium coicis]|nr:hypothetical protein FCOIX_10421 [Fusarium coicis]
MGGNSSLYLATVFTKASVLMFYLRFTVDMHFIICAYAVLFAIVANCIFHTIAPIAYRCPAYEGGNGQGIVDIYAALAVINSVSDLILLLLPFWLLHPMKVPLSRKIGIALILMAGGFVLIVSIVRLWSTMEYSRAMRWCHLRLSTMSEAPVYSMVSSLSEVMVQWI